MGQMIPSGVWTRLDGHDVEIYHECGENAEARVVDTDHGRAVELIRYGSGGEPIDTPEPTLRVEWASRS